MLTWGIEGGKLPWTFRRRFYFAMVNILTFFGPVLDRVIVCVYACPFV